MKLRAMLTAPAAVLAVMAASASVPVSEAHAYACKNSPTQATATYNLRVKAAKKSRDNWTNSVKNQHGLSWSVWSIAGAKSVNCNKSGANWICLASAKPCNYVVQ